MSESIHVKMSHCWKSQVTAELYLGFQSQNSKFRHNLHRVVEIPCQTCLTLSHFIQDKLKIPICHRTSINKVNAILYFFFINNYELTMPCCMENSVYPDWLPPSEAS